MPNAIVHYTFAKENVEDPSAHLDATFVGAQGPDPFFFYGVLPGKKRPFKNDVQSLGGITQHGELAAPYSAMIAYALKSPQKSLLLAYIDGLFMHYAVDRACHPYIFYQSGFTDRPSDSKAVQHHYNYSHMCLEVALDYLIGHREKTFTRIERLIALSSADLHAISRLWYEVNLEVQKVPHITPDSFYLSLKDYRATERFAFDPLGLKKPLFAKIFGRESYPTGLVMPRNLNRFKGIDFLNESHQEWRMPAGERRHESVDDLLGEAKATYHALHAALQKAENGADVFPELDEVGAHINHEGIIPNSPKIYWKLIWPADFIADVIPHNEPQE